MDRTKALGQSISIQIQQSIYQLPLVAALVLSGCVSDYGFNGGDTQTFANREDASALPTNLPTVLPTTGASTGTSNGTGSASGTGTSGGTGTSSGSGTSTGSGSATGSGS
ncbi:MAG: hypothetical protein EOP09_15025, partial [Proteobacteria bacterium]